nr:hypothetical protein [Antrihabitans stalactiti]
MSHAAIHLQVELASGSVIDMLGDRHDMRSSILDGHVDGVVSLFRSGQPVELVNDDMADLAALKIAQQPLEFWTPGGCAGIAKFGIFL